MFRQALLILFLSLSFCDISAQRKEMDVEKIDSVIGDPSLVISLLDSNQVTFNSIESINWEQYPYCPDVKFRIAYTSSSILLHFKVDEKCVRGIYAEANKPVYKDSCVEFFISPSNDGTYYNIECNCIGYILMCCRGGGKREEIAPLESVEKILRWSTLGRDPFEERVEDTEWELALIIPFDSFFRHSVESMDGMEVSANFYKCGNDLKYPHYITWSPIPTERVTFHNPQYFGKLNFK